MPFLNLLLEKNHQFTEEYLSGLHGVILFCKRGWKRIAKAPLPSDTSEPILSLPDS